MSLQEDIKYVKKELSTEESFLESFLKIEKFYKKYKFAIIGLVILIIIGAIGSYSYSYIQLQKKIAANEAFNSVLNNPKDQKALEILKSKDKNLYEMALLMNGKEAKSDNRFLNDLAAYTKAIKKDNINGLNALTQEQDFLLKDFALLNKAILEAKTGKYTEAKASLSLIPKDSNIQSMAQMLQHFLLTK